MKVDDAVDKSDDSQDVGPLQASRMWITQAENNVIDRLVEAGLVAPLTPGGYENKVLDQIVINLVVPNNLAFTDQSIRAFCSPTPLRPPRSAIPFSSARGLLTRCPAKKPLPR